MLPPPAPPTHVPVLDHLRGLAALLVCGFHFACGNPSFLPDDDPLKIAGSFGWVGVEMFFTISGFVIPYSMHLRSHRAAQTGSFLARRLARLEPPYLATIALVLLLSFLSSRSPGFAGQPFELEPARLLAHLAYLNAFLGYAWLNPVFWTLAIEFQFYLFVALLFPLLRTASPPLRIALVATTAGTGFAGAGATALLPHWLPLFALGMAMYLIVADQAPQRASLLLAVAVAGVGWMIVGPLQVAASAFAAVAILSFRYHNPPKMLQPLAWVGSISYSLYLLHVPIGGRVINLAMRLPETPMLRYAMIGVALAISLAASVVFYRLVERPSQRWSKLVNGKRKKETGGPVDGETGRQGKGNTKDENRMTKREAVGT